MANLVPPESLKQIKPYITLASQLDQKNERAVAYYCRLYAVQTGMAVNKTSPDCKVYLATLLDLIESTKNQNKNDESIQSQIVGQAYIERFALKIFEKADEDDRQARFTKNLVKQFYSAGLLFDVLNFFGELSEDLVGKKQYAKRKAMYLNRCFQSGETPIAGPLIGEEFGNDELGGLANDFGAAGISSNNEQKPSSNYNYNNDSYSPSASMPKPTSYNEPSNQRPSSSNYSSQNNAASYSTHNNEETSGSSSFPPELLAKAQKYCKFATSALQYEDVQTAIKNLELCLDVLKHGK